MDGNKRKWNLQTRFAAGERWPPLGKDGHDAKSFTTYLKRRKLWQLLKEEAKHQGEVLTTNAFRYRYAQASHAAGLQIANIAQAIGHAIEVHLSSYSYAPFTPNATSDLYAKVNTETAKVKWNQIPSFRWCVLNPRQASLECHRCMGYTWLQIADRYRCSANTVRRWAIAWLLVNRLRGPRK